MEIYERPDKRLYQEDQGRFLVLEMRVWCHRCHHTNTMYLNRYIILDIESYIVYGTL